MVDTSALIDWDDLDIDETEEYSASLLTRAELEFGINLAQDPQSRAERQLRLNELDAKLDWIAFDLRASRSYGVVGAKMHGSRARGQARKTDTFIAAQAHSLGASLMTLNADDFTQIAGLVKIIKPRKITP